MKNRKRYQVFISSTYKDLKEERLVVLQNLLRLNCFPAGMELFPAANDEQFEYIKRIIDLSDYYILIIAGRYGSVDSTGVSYTEKEYDYALEKGIPILVFIHSNPEKLPRDFTETDGGQWEKLDAFKEKVGKNRLVRQWITPNDLASEIILSLTEAFENHPRLGWSRGESKDSEELFREYRNINKENESLKAQILNLQKKEHQDLEVASYKMFNIVGTMQDGHGFSGVQDINKEIKMIEIFEIIAPQLYVKKYDWNFKDMIEEFFRNYFGCGHFEISTNSYQRIKNYFIAKKFIEVGIDVIDDYQETEYFRLGSFGKEMLAYLVEESDDE